MSETVIVAAGPADRPPIAAMLARAFHDDPVFRWMLPDDARRSAKLPILFDLLYRLNSATGHALKAPDARGASLWQPPGTAELPKLTIARHLATLLEVMGWHALRSLAVSNAIAAHQPRDQPFWYAHFIGVDPASQGQGVGAAMVRAGLTFGARAGIATYLETARPENVSFYLGLGFTVLGEWDVPKGPHFWSMLHRP